MKLNIRALLMENWFWIIIFFLFIPALYYHDTLINKDTQEKPYIGGGVAPLTEEMIKFSGGALLVFVGILVNGLLFYICRYFRPMDVKYKWDQDYRIYIVGAVFFMAIVVGICEGVDSDTGKLGLDDAFIHAIQHLAFSFIPAAIYYLYQDGILTFSALGNAILFHSMANTLRDKENYMFYFVYIIFILEILIWYNYWKTGKFTIQYK